jgi:hypothetical protein
MNEYEYEYDSNVFYNKTLHSRNKASLILSECTSKLHCLDFDMRALVLQKAFADCLIYKFA